MEPATAVVPALTVEEAASLERMSAILRIVADEKRLKMLYLLTGGELCVCKIMEALGISQALASHHLGVMREAGLVSDRRDARWVHYSLNVEAFAELEQLLGSLAHAGPAEDRAGSIPCGTPGDACA